MRAIRKHTRKGCLFSATSFQGEIAHKNHRIASVDCAVKCVPYGNTHVKGACSVLRAFRGK